MPMNFHRKLPSGGDIKEDYPLTEKMIQVKKARDEKIKAVFEGTLDKFILVIGPCSADLGVMMNSIVAAQSSHTFIYRG